MLIISVSQVSQVTDGNVCAPGGENGVYHPVTGGTINSTRGPFGASFSSDGYFINEWKIQLQFSATERSPTYFAAGISGGLPLFQVPRQRFGIRRADQLAGPG